MTIFLSIVLLFIGLIDLLIIKNFIKRNLMISLMELSDGEFGLGSLIMLVIAIFIVTIVACILFFGNKGLVFAIILCILPWILLFL